MPEKTTWQVKAVELEEIDPEDLGDWEPIGFSDDGYLLLKRQTIIEVDDKSSIHHELTFQERYER